MRRALVTEKKTLPISALIVVLLLGVVVSSTGMLGKKPFKDLRSDEIVSVSVHLSPPDKTVHIAETRELLEHLKEVVIFGKDNSYTTYAGQACAFTVTKTDGTVIAVTTYNPFIIIDGVGYRCEYEPCEALNSYANRLLND